MANSSTGPGYFLSRRLHSLMGIVLTLAYVVSFLVPMSAGISGVTGFNQRAVEFARLPFADVAGVLFVIIPLVLHVAVGVSIIYRSQFNIISYGFYRNWMYVLERLTGLGLILFIIYHILKTKLAFAFTGRVADFAVMQETLSSSAGCILYCAGVVCAAFHIGNGLSSFLMRWGITVSRRSQNAAVMASWVVTLLLMIWGLRTVLSFRL